MHLFDDFSLQKKKKIIKFIRRICILRGIFTSEIKSDQYKFRQLDQRLSHYSFLQLTNQIKMLSNRVAKAIPSKNKQNNYQKPYSLLSLDSLFLNSKNNNGSRDLPSVKPFNMKKMGQNKQNCDSENVIKGKKKIVQAKIQYSRSGSFSFADRELSDNYNMMFDGENSFQNTGITGSSQQLKLENITNRIGMNEPCLKEKDWMNSNVFQSQPFLLEDEDKSIDNRIYVDMKKKIKKISASKRGIMAKPAEKSQRELKKQLLMNKIYSDSEVIADGCIFRHKLISQRIDNDVDTDDEQIISGIKRLEKSLLDALEQNRLTQREKLEIKDFGSNELQFFML